MISTLSGTYLIVMIVSFAITCRLPAFRHVIPWTLYGFGACIVTMFTMILLGIDAVDPSLLLRLGIIVVSLGHLIAVLVASRMGQDREPNGTR